MYAAAATEPIGYFKIKAIELLYHMDQLTQVNGCDLKYFDKKQIQATKAIREYLISHLDEKISLEQLAKDAHLNLSVFPYLWGHAICLPEKIQNEFGRPVAFGKQNENWGHCIRTWI